MSAAGNDNTDNGKIIIFTIKDTMLYVPVVTLSARDNKKLSKRLSKRFERWIYWNEYKTKVENKNTANEFRNFFESNFVGVKILFVLVYTNEDTDCKSFKAETYYLSKWIIDNYNVIINGKNFYDQLIDSDRKRYKEIRKLTTRQSEDYNTGCLLDYEYIKNNYTLIAVDLSRQKELDADPKAIHQIEFDGYLKKN